MQIFLLLLNYYINFAFEYIILDIHKDLGYIDCVSTNSTDEFRSLGVLVCFP